MLDGAGGSRLDRLGERLRALGIGVERVGRVNLDRRCEGGRHQGIVVETDAPAPLSLGDLESLVVARGRLTRLLLLDQVEDPRNLGAILRTADAAGVDAIVVPKSGSAKLTPAASKAAAGAAETVPVAVVPNLSRAMAWLKQAGVWLVGTDAQAGAPLYSGRLEPPIGIVLGGEGRGLRRLTRETCDELVAIPMHGAVESLNVSVAAGIVLFELTRQSPPAVR